MIDLAPETAAEQSAPSLIPVPSAAQAALLPVKTLLALAAWFRHQGDFPAAESVLTATMERSTSFQLVHEQALLAMAQGRPEAAIAGLRAEAGQRDTITAWGALAKMLLEAGDPAAVASIVAWQLAANPDAVTVQLLAADHARATGQTALAREFYDAAAGLSPGNIAAQLGLGRLALETGDRRQAASLLAALLAAVEADERPPGPTTLQALAALALLLDQPVRAAALRARAAALEARHTAQLRASLKEVLGNFATPDFAAGEIGGTVSDEAAGANWAVPRGATVSTPALAPDSNNPPPDGKPPTMSIVSEVPDHAAPIATDPAVLAILRDDFGYASLRPGQAAVIANTQAGHNTLAVMPTGAGKSLTFQIPAMLGAGVTLVISPLIALMKDQVDSLPPGLRAHAAMLNSAQSSDQQREVLAGLRQGALKMIYVAPERLRQQSFVRELRQTGVSLVVVDEAHCISLWGHDFRPDYLTIPTVLGDLGEPPLLAITATATRRMADDIKRRFGRELSEIRTSVYRPNLYYEAQILGTREQKIERVIAICQAERGAGIIYARSRRDTEAIAALLRDRRVQAVPYHAGLDSATRSGNQERFMSGESRVIVATTAFGMGINKADVRFIVHLSPPNSLEAYAQESGRAGRDGGPARCILLATRSDKSTLTRMARADLPEIDGLRRVYAALKQTAVGAWALTAPESLVRWQPFDDEAESEPDPRIALSLLEQAGLLRRYPDQPTSYTLPRTLPAAPDPETADDWAALREWCEAQGDATSFRTASALAGLNWTPERLTRTLTANLTQGLHEGTRQACFELLPAGADALARIELVLARVRQESDTRIALVMSYVGATRCRHLLLASHLGESLPACREHCDFCRPAATADGEAAATPSERSRVTAEDAQAVLTAMGSLPLGLGKPGLVKFLLGSIESRIRGDRSPHFGALTGVRKGALEKLLDRLTEGGLIEPYLDREYRLLRLTPAGKAATRTDLETMLPAAVTPTATRNGGSGSADLDEALFERLRVWRREVAGEQGVAPFIVAPDSALRGLAEHRPRALHELADVPGFGPARVERYGAAIIALINDDAAPDPLP